MNDKTITLLRTKSLRKKRSRKLINRLLRAGYSLRLTPNVEAARFDRR